MLNEAKLIGNLTADPEAKQTPNGNKVVNFSVATNKTYKDKNGDKQQETQFHRIVAWGYSANYVEKYLKKGDLVLVSGEIRTRSWEKDDGSKAYMTEIRADRVQSLSKRGDRSNAGNAMEDGGSLDDYSL